MSGIDWLGEVNPSWGYAPLFTLGNPKKTPNRGMIEQNLLSLSYGRVVRRDIESSEGLVPASYETYQIVEPGDTVLRFTDLQNDQRSLRSGLVRERGIITSAYLSFTPDEGKLYPAFFAYLMRAVDLSKVFYRMGSGVRQSLNWGEFSLIRLPLPPLENQRRIADYLDRETAEIDAAVADLDRYVGLLERRKFSVLTQALPNPSDKKRTDGSKFASWESRPLWSMFVREKILGFVDEPMVSVFRDRGVVYKDEHDNLNRTAEDKSIYQLIQPGWLAVNRMKAWQGSVGVSEIRGITSGHYICFRPIHGQDHKFINYLLRSPGYITWYWKHSRGVRPGQAEIDNQWLNGMPILFPSVDVQREITDHLDREIAEIDALIAKSTKLRDLLLQRRSVLITEVVTGRKQV